MSGNSDDGPDFIVGLADTVGDEPEGVDIGTLTLG